jgi:hypothetical protein
MHSAGLEKQCLRCHESGTVEAATEGDGKLKNGSAKKAKGKATGAKELATCGVCGLYYHLNCLGLSERPAQPWSCPHCHVEVSKLYRLESHGRLDSYRPSSGVVTDAEVLAACESLDFGKPNVSRKNVKETDNTRLFGFVLGILNARAHGVQMSTATIERPNFGLLLAKWAAQHLPPDFEFTSIQVNKNYNSALHVDSNNLGPSYVVGVGDFTEGQLWVEGLGVTDVKGKWTAFDGNIPHMTLPFSGTRYTFIFFTHMSYKCSRDSCLDFVQQATCFPIPNKNTPRFKGKYLPPIKRLAAARGEATLAAYNARLALKLPIDADMEKTALAQMKKNKGGKSKQSESENSLTAESE